VTEPVQGPPSDAPYGAGYPGNAPQAAGYPGGYAPGPVRRTNTLAIVSLVAGLCGFTVVPVLGSVAAIITGHMALREIRETGEEGTSFAKVGLWLGYILIGLAVLFAVGAVLLVTIAAVSSR